MAQPDTDGPGVRVPPPLIFLGFLIIGLWYDSPWFDGSLATMEVTVVGGIIAVLGFLLIATNVRQHKSAGSNVEPWKPTTTIITAGAYKYTRNPIYLGMALTHGGLALSGGSMAAGVTLVLSIAVIQTYVISREERYLQAKFGEVYRTYRSQVRRWL